MICLIITNDKSVKKIKIIRLGIASRMGFPVWKIKPLRSSSTEKKESRGAAIGKLKVASVNFKPVETVTGLWPFDKKTI